MHKGKEVLFIHLMTFDQPAQGSAVHFIVLLSQNGNIPFRDAHVVAHVDVHAFLDRIPQACGCRIKRVVEIEENS